MTENFVWQKLSTNRSVMSMFLYWHNLHNLTLKQNLSVKNNTSYRKMVSNWIYNLQTFLWSYKVIQRLDDAKEKLLSKKYPI